VLNRRRRGLLAVLGVTFGLAVTIGNTIGAGILRTPGAIAEHLPSFWLFLSVWVIGGTYALLGSNALSELGTMTPRSGGQYVFVRRALGDYAGFIVGWSDWISTCGATAAMVIVVGEYTVVLFPRLRIIEVVALVTLALFTLVQWFGVRAGAVAQDLTTLLKLIAFVILIGACFYIGTRNPAASAFDTEREGSLLLAFVLSLQAVIYTYDGWSAVVYFSEEVKKPGRDIPRSMIGGALSVTAIYLLINVGFMRVVPLGTIAGSKLAAGTVARYIFGPHGDTVLRGLMVVALLSAVNSSVLMAPRVIFAMSHDGLFWRSAREVNRGGTPDVALLFSSALTAIFIVTGTFYDVIAKLAFFFVANYALSFISLFVLRRREPAAERPYRAWGHPITTAVALAASLLFLGGAVTEDLHNSLWALALLALSVPVFLFVRARASGSDAAGH
jgi:basic amino acid/polyamine antiporter, APA family